MLKYVFKTSQYFIQSIWFQYVIIYAKREPKINTMNDFIFHFMLCITLYKNGLI